MDQDNLAASLKGVQDGIAAALGEDDGKLRWAYDQSKSPSPKLFGVTVELYL